MHRSVRAHTRRRRVELTTREIDPSHASSGWVPRVSIEYGNIERVVAELQAHGISGRFQGHLDTANAGSAPRALNVGEGRHASIG
jgi:hypothetical protein